MPGVPWMAGKSGRTTWDRSPEVMMFQTGVSGPMPGMPIVTRLKWGSTVSGSTIHLMA